MALNDQVRYRILERLYSHDQDDPGSLGIDRQALISILGHPENVVDRNVLYLETKGLVNLLKTLGSLWAMAKITAHGTDVIENKDKYRDRYPFVVQVQNIHGDVYGSVVQANESSVTITQTQSGNEFQKARKLVQESELNESVKKEAIANIDLIEQECDSETPNVGKIKSSVDWIKRNAHFVAPIITGVASKVILSQMGIGD